MSDELNTAARASVPVAIKIILLLLTILVLVSLGLNWYLIQQWQQARAQVSQFGRDLQPVVQETFDQVDADLAEFQQSSLEFTFRVNQTLPIQTSIPFNESIDIPVQVVIPVQQEIQTTVMMDPFQTGFQIPVDVTVPIDLEFPIDETVAIEIDRTIPISTSVPLSLTLPITIPINDTNLAPYLDRIRDGADNFEEKLNQTLSGIE
jgi:hypothetical protein